MLVLRIRGVCRNQSCGASPTPGIAPAKQQGVGNELCRTHLLAELPSASLPPFTPERFWRFSWQAGTASDLADNKGWNVIDFTRKTEFPEHPLDNKEMQG